MVQSNRKYPLPSMVAGKAKAAGEVGLLWLDTLDALVEDLAERWKLRIQGVLHGGSHALVCDAVDENDTPCVLKVEIPDLSEKEFLYGVHALRIADGRGYPKLLACDVPRRTCLLEKLGPPLKQFAYPPQRQMEIICDALRQTWAMPADANLLNHGDTSVPWFRTFITEAWSALEKPCSENVIQKAMQYLDSREMNRNPEEYVLVHGDAHNNNILQVPGDPERFKLIDSEGLYCEKAYDLGVLMREWPEAYRSNPIAAWHERAAYLSGMTGAKEDAIREWGFLQMTATALILLPIGEKVLGQEMLQIAEVLCEDA